MPWGGTEAAYFAHFVPAPQSSLSRSSELLHASATSSGDLLANLAGQARPRSSAIPQPSARPAVATGPRVSTEDDIEHLVRLRRIPPGVITRAPSDEVEPTPEPGERVVFGAHFDRGLGLPASPFFRRFLNFFGLQPHHLPANACVLLSCYVAFMEGYAGLWPDIDLQVGSST
ncbi:hypothetical protein QYE76_042355 [Lolium multiflorum]|uniref:Transposase (putative) gypsy type domain-containing protein n=1 Tax=Lolium multiflorum TaxID=4521 RepID=A0AAD8TGN4_LOLMU|nr:hypothetical protein QYE76_042355 [Lolium multiflorum]